MIKISWALIAHSHYVYWQECILAWIIMQEVQTAAADKRPTFEEMVAKEILRITVGHKSFPQGQHKTNVGEFLLKWASVSGEQPVQAALNPDEKYLLHIQQFWSVLFFGFFPLHSARMFREKKKRNTSNSWNYWRTNMLNTALLQSRQAASN